MLQQPIEQEVCCRLHKIQHQYKQSKDRNAHKINNAAQTQTCVLCLLHKMASDLMTILKCLETYRMHKILGDDGNIMVG